MKTKQIAFSLVELLVASSLLGVLALGLSSYMKNQHQGAKSLKETLEALAIQNFLIRTLGDPNICAYVLQNPPIVIDANRIPDSPVNPAARGRAGQTITISSIPIAPNGSAGKIIEVGRPAYGLSINLKVDGIGLTLEEKSGNTFLGYWWVSFEKSAGLKQIKKLKIPTTGEMMDAPLDARV